MLYKIGKVISVWMVKIVINCMMVNGIVECIIKMVVFVKKISCVMESLVRINLVKGLLILLVIMVGINWFSRLINMLGVVMFVCGICNVLSSKNKG